MSNEHDELGVLMRRYLDQKIQDTKQKPPISEEFIRRAIASKEKGFREKHSTKERSSLANIFHRFSPRVVAIGAGVLCLILAAVIVRLLRSDRIASPSISASDPIV